MKQLHLAVIVSHIRLQWCIFEPSFLHHLCVPKWFLVFSCTGAYSNHCFGASCVHFLVSCIQIYFKSFNLFFGLNHSCIVKLFLTICSICHFNSFFILLTRYVTYYSITQLPFIYPTLSHLYPQIQTAATTTTQVKAVTGSNYYN
jgi:hypothetical protein